MTPDDAEDFKEILNDSETMKIAPQMQAVLAIIDTLKMEDRLRFVMSLAFGVAQIMGVSKGALQQDVDFFMSIHKGRAQ